MIEPPTILATTEDVFDALGGPAEVGRAIDKPTEHAASLKRRGRIPPRYWDKLLAALKAKGFVLTEADLVRIYNAAQSVTPSEPATEPAS